MTLYIVRNGNGLVMSPNGGTVTQWLVDGKNVLFPEQLVRIGDKTKLRGGIPVMHPNFGTPPKDETLPKHGFLRNTTLETGITGIKDSGSTLYASYTQHENNRKKDFPFLHSVSIRASLQGNTLSHNIEIRNSAVRIATDMPIGTGIHPYLRLPNGTGTIHIRREETIEINGSYGPRVIIDNPPRYISIDSHGLGFIHMRFAGSFLNEQAVLVIWTDGGKNELGESYICVEPVLAKPDVFSTPEGVYIEAGRKVLMGCSFLFISH